MKNFYKFLSPMMMASAFFTCGDLSATLKPMDFGREVNVHKLMRSMAPNQNVIDLDRSSKLGSVNAAIERKVNPLYSTGEAGVSTPDLTVGPARKFGDIDGPNGEVWYYTTDFVCRTIEYQYYVEYILEEYTFTFFNSKMEQVGKVHDKMRYSEGEVRVPGPDLGIDILPVITQHYFNNDDNYEVVVSIAVNTEDGYGNNYRSVVYSLGGETEVLPVYNPATEAYEDKECDKIVAVYPAFVGDVLDASKDGKEEYYMTFMSEISGEAQPEALNTAAVAEEDEDDPVGEEFWNLVCSYKLFYQMYGKADANGKLQHVLDIEIPVIQSQGDQENTPPMLTLMHGGTGYLVKPYYEKPFYNPYYSANDDLSMRADNSLKIDLYKIENCQAELVKSTLIKTEKDEGEDVLATYFALGDMRYSKDVDFANFGGEYPAYYITRSNYVSSTDDLTGFCHYVYDSEGNKIRTIFEYSDADAELFDAEGLRPQHLFVDFDDDGNYRYNFVDLIDGAASERTVKIGSLLKFDEEDDGDLMKANVDRVLLPDGSYKYAFEMRSPGVDEYDNDVMRVSWFDADGQFDRTDHINMGKNVYFAQVYINGAVLYPDLFAADDDAHEYLVLVKRGLEAGSSASQEDLVLGQPESDANPEGRTILHLVPDEKGTLAYVGVFPNGKGSSLEVTYATGSEDKNQGYITDFYYLPFQLSAIEDIEADSAKGQISFDGSEIAAEGEIIVYNLKGIIEAKGQNQVSVSHLVPGVYVAVAGDKVYKFSK